MDKIKAPVVKAPGRGGEHMVHRGGKWWYKGNAFDTLHEALLSVWPKK